MKLLECENPKCVVMHPLTWEKIANQMGESPKDDRRQYSGRPVYLSENCEVNHIYFLNSDY